MKTKNQEIKLKWEEFTAQKELYKKYPEIDEYLRTVGVSIGGLIALKLAEQKEEEAK